jgi:hypothetical protein
MQSEFDNCNLEHSRAVQIAYLHGAIEQVTSIYNMKFIVDSDDGQDSY